MMAPPGHSPELEELLTLYALGAAEGSDLAAVEEHLATGCPECQRQLSGRREDLEALALSPPPLAPSEAVRARLLASLPPAESAQLAPITELAGRRRGGAVGRGWLAAAAVLLLALGWGWLAARQEATALRAERTDLVRQAAALHSALAASQAQSERLAQAMAILSAPGMRPLALAALQAPPGARGYTFVDPRAGKALFVAADLPPLAPGKTYELWFIADGKPVPAGTFGVDAAGRSGTVQVDRVAPVDHIQAWAVTIEPQGGVPQPTGPMVLKG
jgi:anti-sigma-K factor RskA